MADMTHKISVFVKLSTFQTSADKVKLLLEDIARKYSETVNVRVENYAGITASDSTAVTHTVVIVIDTWQSRVCITPSRQDSMSDLRDEIGLLTDQVTRPRGSILIVLYGDDKSRGMDEDKLVADPWLRVWKHADEQAYAMATDARIFSIVDKFNMKQETAIVDYFKKLIVFPATIMPVRRASNVLVIGPENAKGISETRLFNTNPLMMTKTLRQSGKLNIEGSLHLPHADQEVGFANATLKTYSIYLPTSMMGRGSVHKDSQTCCDYRSLSKGNFLKNGFSNLLDLSCLSLPLMSWMKRFPTFQRIILFFNCEKCFVETLDDIDDLGRRLHRILRKLNIKCNGDILPLMVGKPPSKDCTERTPSSSLTHAMYECLKDLIDRETGLSEEELQRKRERLDICSKEPDLLAQMYDIHAFHPQRSSKAISQKHP
ncbi:uncharacterized protein [Ptychodera flava]|uniref:uncharacterized protein n=1 Tax=Ptychodera flava TaxID=63121 RepID=UPI00396A160E